MRKSRPSQDQTVKQRHANADVATGFKTAQPAASHGAVQQEVVSYTSVRHRNHHDAAAGVEADVRDERFVLIRTIRTGW